MVLKFEIGIRFFKFWKNTPNSENCENLKNSENCKNSKKSGNPNNSQKN